MSSGGKNAALESVGTEVSCLETAIEAVQRLLSTAQVMAAAEQAKHDKH